VEEQYRKIKEIPWGTSTGDVSINICEGKRTYCVAQLYSHGWLERFERKTLVGKFVIKATSNYGRKACTGRELASPN
jgi:hypothetical protein